MDKRARVAEILKHAVHDQKDHGNRAAHLTQKQRFVLKTMLEERNRGNPVDFGRPGQFNAVFSSLQQMGLIERRSGYWEIVDAERARGMLD